jgi:radical SAM superfamily enzyme YgiQ (UPF0313 family)
MNKKILLLLLPFWTPLIPSMGLACLKSFLSRHGYSVKVADANVDGDFRQVYDDYFALLGEIVPGDKQGNFYNTGIDVLQNHMTAYFSKKEEAGPAKSDTAYRELIHTLVDRNFFCKATESQVEGMDEIIARFYELLDRYMKGLLEKEKPGVLGLSMYKGNFAATLFAFKRCKENYPGIETVMGGGIFSDQLAVGSPNFEYFLERTPYIDHIIVGEGELLFLKLLKGELPAEQKVYTSKDVAGEILDLSSAPLPDFSDFDIPHYTQLACYTSRSCPFQCGFCAETVNWGKYRKKDAARVVEELKKLYDLYGSQLYLMSDSLLNPIVEDLSRELADADITIYWDGYLRADKHACDPGNTFLWRRGGFYRARMGIESGSPRVLKLMDKRITPEQIKVAIANLALAGIKTSTYWVIGYPGETEEDFQVTLDIIEEMKENLYEAECNPFRFYLTGQVRSSQWMEESKSKLLYPASTREFLIMQTWVLENGVGREEIYDRLNRFVAHCSRLGIPNPYSWPDIHKADERWRKLHANAAPPLVAFKDADSYIDECRKVEQLLPAQQIVKDEGDFDF